jgi:hypothetical protein
MREPLTRFILILLAALALASCASADVDGTNLDLPPLEQSAKGHVAFFFTGGMEYKDNRAAYGEFIYGYASAKRSLLSEGYSYSYHSELPLEIDNGDLKLSLSKDNLWQGAGLVLVKSKNRFRVIYGIFTGPDIVKMSREYFTRRP